MTCSYCDKNHKFVFVLQEDVPGVGPSIRHACFQCIQVIGEKIMKEVRQAEVQPSAPPEVTAGLTSCIPCSGCGGMRMENCKNPGLHGHTWCDCQ
jgi:hypothetical protein